MDIKNSGFYLCDRTIVRGVQLLKFLHADVINFDFFVGGSNTNANPARMKVQMLSKSLGFLEDMDGFGSSFVKNSD